MKTNTKIIGLIIVVIFTLKNSSIAQDKYFTRDGYISFFSTTPVEDIKAINENVTCVLDAETGAIELAALMKAFKFKKALMEEHFNENYVESEKYPKATFKGAITNFSSINLKEDGIYEAQVKGTLTIHGESKEVSTIGAIEVRGANLSLNSEFNVSPEDYAIEIPSVVRDKIANELLITFKAELAPFKR